MMGVNSRGLALAANFALQPNCEVISISDVDTRAADKCIDTVEKTGVRKPKNEPDFRKALEDKDLDALVIAAPDHWHAPAAILASKAGKHVYLEKPCSHNPHEGELLVAVAAKIQKCYPDGQPAPVVAQCGAGYRGSTGRGHRSALFCQRLVYQQPRIHWHRQRQ